MPSLFQECYIQLTSSEQFFDTGTMIPTILDEEENAGRGYFRTKQLGKY